MEKKVPIKPTESFPLGDAKENKQASAYTGFKYPSGGGDDIGVYKQPMNISVDAKVHEQGENTNILNISVGNVSKNKKDPDNKYGRQDMRGYGAATKGRDISNKLG